MRYRREEAGIAFVASDVWYLIQHLKDNDLRYQNNNLVYTNNLGQLYIAGVLIVPVDQEVEPDDFEGRNGVTLVRFCIGRCGVRGERRVRAGRKLRECCSE